MKSLSRALMLLAGTVALPAQAGRALRVTFADCPGWAAEEVERLVRLELATVGGGESDVGAADVEISCDDTGASLKASDPQTRRSLSRRLELSATAEDSARTLAISTAQLVRALDWLGEPAPAPPVAPASPRLRPAPPPRERQRQLELQLGTGARARDLRTPFASYRATLNSTFRIGESLGVGGGLHYERGDADRAPGQVQSELVGASLVSNLEPWRGERWSCLLRLELGLDRISLRGHDAERQALTGRLRGWGTETQLAVGPALRFADWGVALLAQAGGSYFGGKGLVSQDADVDLNGGWAGAELAVLWAP